MHSYNCVQMRYVTGCFGHSEECTLGYLLNKEQLLRKKTVEVVCSKVPNEEHVDKYVWNGCHGFCNSYSVSTQAY